MGHDNRENVLWASSQKNWGSNFFGELISELKKVVWLSRREVVYLSTIVLIITIIAGLALGLLDYGFSKLVDAFFIP